MKYIRIVAVPMMIALIIAVAVTGAQATGNGYIAAQNSYGHLDVYSADGTQHIINDAPSALGLGLVSGVAFASNGDLYACGTLAAGGDGITKLAYQGNGTWASAFTPVMTTSQVPLEMTVDSLGNVYFAQYSSTNLVKYNANGTQAWSISMPPSGVNSNTDVRIVPTNSPAYAGDVAVCRDYGNSGGYIYDGIEFFNPTTGSMDGQVANDSRAYNQGGFDFDQSGNVVFSGLNNNRSIWRINPSTLVSTTVFYTSATTYSQCEYSTTTKADYNGDGTNDIFVADAAINGIDVFDGVTGNPIATIANGRSINELDSWTPAAVPEPSALIVLIPGVAGLLGAATRKRR
jgi:hypothetical protein